MNSLLASFGFSILQNMKLIVENDTKVLHGLTKGRAESKTSLENNLNFLSSTLEMFSSNIGCSLVELTYCATYQTAQLITQNN